MKKDTAPITTLVLNLILCEEVSTDPKKFTRTILLTAIKLKESETLVRVARLLLAHHNDGYSYYCRASNSAYQTILNTKYNFRK